ncbi:MAG TPA: hypothetical protein PK340_01125 [Bacilli bacterium]|nr:hypothetical protein [Bacilli bacterium]
MIKKILYPLSGVLALFVLTWIAQSGLLIWLRDFLIWYINFMVTASTLNNVFVLIGKILTWVISYFLVGVIFNKLGWFNSKVMHITYVVIAFIINIFLTIILMFVQEYAVWIVSGLIIIAICLIIFVVVYAIRENKRE